MILTRGIRNDQGPKERPRTKGTTKDQRNDHKERHLHLECGRVRNLQYLCLLHIPLPRLFRVQQIKLRYAPHLEERLTLVLTTIGLFLWRNRGNTDFGNTLVQLCICGNARFPNNCWAIIGIHRTSASSPY